MSVTADGDRRALGHIVLNHCRLVVHQLLDREDDLVNVFFVKPLPVLESFNHVVDKLLGHLIAQPRAIILFIDGHVLQVQALRSRRRILDLNGLEESIALDNLLAFGVLKLGIPVRGILLDDNFPVTQCIAMVEDGRVGDGSTVVGLYIVGIKFERFCGIRDCKPVGLEFNVRLSKYRR